MDHRRRWLAFILLIVAAGAAGLGGWWLSRSDENDYTSFSGEIFATRYHITYRGGPSADKVRQAVEAELDRVDALASTWKADSELMRYNRSDEPEAFELSQDLKDLLGKARQIEVQTDRAFTLRPDGEQIDLSGIAKGYAVDRVVAVLQEEFGMTDCLVDIGGEVKALGDGPTGDGWRVSLYMPSEHVDREPPKLRLKDTSVATSGSYFQGGHIIDPQTGKPVANDLLSASVIHPMNTDADALATALYVMGAERGLAWAKENGVHVIFLLKDGTRRDYEPE